MKALGDIHGNFRLINQYGVTGNIIQVGDFGLGFSQKDLKTMDHYNESWRARKIHVYAIRGNHDDPQWWNGQFDSYWSNIHLVPDYTVLELEGKKILCVGGARSVDRADRVEKKEGKWPENVWFPGEEFNYDEDELTGVLAKHQVDIVVTHNAPNFCIPLGTTGESMEHYKTRDAHLILDVQLERELLARMHKIMKDWGNEPKVWIYGHHHRNHTEFIEGTKFILLGIGEITNI